MSEHERQYLNVVKQGVYVMDDETVEGDRSITFCSDYFVMSNVQHDVAVIGLIFPHGYTLAAP